MTHVVFISRYYTPEKAAAAVCVSEIAKGLVKRGHQVTVLTTFPNYPTGIVPPEYRGHKVKCEVIEGVRVVRVWSYTSENKGFLRRTLAQLSFGCTAPFLGGKVIGQPDVIIVESPPLFNVIAARVLARGKHCPFIFWVADLWPESAVQLGALRNKTLIRLSEWLEWSTYQRASLVWAVTEGMRDTLIRRGLSPEHLLLITNGVDTAKFHSMPKAQARTELGWDNRFTLLYAGNHGLVYGLTTVLDAAELMREYTDIHIILVGDGVKKAELIAQAKRRNINNVTFLDSMPHDRIPLLLAAADVCLIPLRNLPLLEGSLPVKMFEAMAAGRPILLAMNGEARRLAVQEAGAAIYVEPENPNALISAILHLREHPEVAEQLGRRGRTFVETRFDYNRLTATLHERISTLLNLDKEASIVTPIPPTPLSTQVERS